MSERKDAIHRIAEFVNEHNLTNPFGGYVCSRSHTDSPTSGIKYYSVAFSMPRTLDGVVKLYGLRFILIDTQGPAGYSPKVFESVDHAIDFLKAAFVEFDRDAAETVPTKPEKS